jgi:inhibitor of KinA
MTQDIVIRPVGDRGLLVELGSVINEQVHDRVIALNESIDQARLRGVTETAPAYTTILVSFDPTETDRDLAADSRGVAHIPTIWKIPVCYDGVHAPDRDAVAQRTGLDSDAVADCHRSARFRVYMYGFAPGYAYLGGVPTALQLPRKTVAVRGHPVGSVLIAGTQCLVTTLPMPTGWWVIGRSPLQLLGRSEPCSLLFQPGDEIQFERIDAAAFDRACGL